MVSLWLVDSRLRRGTGRRVQEYELGGSVGARDAGVRAWSRISNKLLAQASLPESPSSSYSVEKKEDSGGIRDRVERPFQSKANANERFVHKEEYI